MSQGLKPGGGLPVDVRAEARTYLRSKGRSRFPKGMTERKARAKTKEEAKAAAKAEADSRRE
jgi:hypothetical protein